MKLRAKQDAQAPDAQGRMTYRRGPEYDLHNKLIEGGEPFDAPDDFVVNTDVFDIVEPPKGRDPRIFDPSKSAGRK